MEEYNGFLCYSMLEIVYLLLLLFAMAIEAAWDPHYFNILLQLWYFSSFIRFVPSLSSSPYLPPFSTPPFSFPLLS